MTPVTTALCMLQDPFVYGTIIYDRGESVNGWIFHKSMTLKVCESKKRMAP